MSHEYVMSSQPDDSLLSNGVITCHSNETKSRLLKFIFKLVSTHAPQTDTYDVGSKTLRAKKENHEGETMTISHKSKLEMRNRNYKQKGKKKKKSQNGKKTLNNRVANESADQLSCLYCL